MREKRETHDRQKKKKSVYFIDYEFLIILIFLTCFGLVMLYSAAAHITPFVKGSGSMTIFERQVVFALLGFAGMYVISKIDYHFYGKAAVLIYAVSLFLMLLVKTPLGYDGGGGAVRSLHILPGRGITVEPSELGKAGIIIFTAYLICRISRQLDTAKAFMLILALSAFTGLWVKYFTTNLSTGIIIAAIPVCMFFVANPRVMPFLLLMIFIAALGAAVIIYAIHSPEEGGEGHGGGKSYQFERIRAWVNTSEDIESKGTYQVKQGMYAIGSGGFWGKGLGKSTQKLGAIPLVQNDMILPVICEELGIFGAAVILALFGYLLFRLMFIAKNAPDMFGALLVCGVLIHVALQVALNVAVITNMAPTTGVTLPFFSSGGSALLCLLAEMGIVWGVSRKIVLE